MTNPDSHAVYASIIGLHKEFEERYIILHQHTFPEVLERIRQSNISDFSIFLHNGVLFSHMVYTGKDYSSDMAAIGDDPDTRSWWKLTDPMQEPMPGRKEGEWWSAADLVFEARLSKRKIENPIRLAFISLKISDSETIATKHNAIENSLKETGDSLQMIRVFKRNSSLYFYLESAQMTDGIEYQNILQSTFQLEEAPLLMKEVFHIKSNPEMNVQDRKKVFVTGCFDLLHSGHVAFLQETASYGDLYVSIGSDENVLQLKGRYPVNSQEERKYMISALACVTRCEVNSGWGYIDFEKEIQIIAPDIFIVNEDGHSPAKQALCRENDIEYKVLKRIPHANMPSRSTTSLRTECTIPFRIDLAGGWLDQPFVSKFYPGPVLTISIEPTVAFNERSGMASSTRRKAIELWSNEIPHGNPETLAKILFTFENPPGTKEVAGSQDSLGIVLPGLNKLDYSGKYWPEKITSVMDEDILCWLEEHLYLVSLGPRGGSYSVLDNTFIDEAGARELASAANDCWAAILHKDIQSFGYAFKRSFEAQLAMFPNMQDDMIRDTIRQYEEQAWGWKLSGAGGGGYLILIAREPIGEAMQIKIRRKSTF